MIKRILRVIMRTYKTNLKPLAQWLSVSLGILGISYLPSDMVIVILRLTACVSIVIPFVILTYIAIKTIRLNKKGWVNK